MPTFALIIPVRNAESHAKSFLDSLQMQSIRADKFVVVDSSSLDRTREIFRQGGAVVKVIPPYLFDHGRTRQMAADLALDADLLVFLTHDTILANSESIPLLLECFNDPEVVAAYGRQLPRTGAGPFEFHARRFNYPPVSRVKTVDDIANLGLKTAFISNSFAAYRRSALEAIGGFPMRCIVSEDTYVAARMILAGWKIVYCAEAEVYHSHDYNYCQDFQRYFDIGVFHAREPWVRKSSGGAEGEGLRFLRSELRYLFGASPWLIPSALVRTLIKYTGFRAGQLEKHLPFWLKRRMSMQKAFWDQEMDRIQNA